MVLTHALALSASQFVHKRKSLRIYTSMHSEGLELTKTDLYQARREPDTPPERPTCYSRLGFSYGQGCFLRKFQNDRSHISGFPAKHYHPVLRYFPVSYWVICKIHRHLPPTWPRLGFPRPSQRGLKRAWPSSPAAPESGEG